MTDIEKLFLRIGQMAYPPEMVAVSGSIAGSAFFPGGSGILDAEKQLCNKLVMVLGQDFDCESNYQLSLSNGREDVEKNATWRNLLPLLRAAGIAPADCFYTSAIMGVRKGDSGVGKSPAFKNERFIRQCRDFFLYQLELQKPSVILVLGKYVAEFLSPLAEQLSSWRRVISFAEADRSNAQVREQVLFGNGVVSNLVLLTHPFGL